VGTALIYLLVVVAVAAVVFGIAAAVFGRGEELAPLPPGPTPSRLPDGAVAGDDVRALRFPQAVRGYRMAEVDWALERLAAELDRTAVERDHLRDRLAEIEGGFPDGGVFDEERVFPEDGPVERRAGGAEPRGGV
jgi:DivIVA domain-containing protein